jgi:hypothetical protein
MKSRCPPAMGEKSSAACADPEEPDSARTDTANRRRTNIERETIDRCLELQAMKTDSAPALA